jgi:VWFA-related protein
MRTHLRFWRAFITIGVASVCLAVALPAYADAITVVVQRVDTSQFPTVTAYVSVSNSSGAPLTGLDGSALVVQEDGKPVDLLNVDALADQDPMAVAIVIDVSGEMAQTLPPVKAAADSLIDTLGPSDRGIVVTFGSRVTLVQDYTNDKSALKSAVDSLAAGGNRVVYDSLAQTARRQGAQSEHRKPIILLTNGADTASAEGLDAATQAAATAGSPVYTIGFGPNVTRDSLTRMSSSTAGRSVFLSNPADLQPTYLAIADQIRREYVVRYASKLPMDGGSHGLAIQVTTGGQSVTGLARFQVPAPVGVPTLQPTPVATAQPVAAPATAAPPSVDPTLLLGLLLLLALGGVALFYLTRRTAAPAVVAPAKPTPPIEATMARGSDQTWIVDDPGAGAAGRTMMRHGREPTPPQVRLAIVQDGQPSEFVSRESPIVLGRSKERVNVFIPDPLVSGEHARIRRDGSAFYLEDLTSKNGTRLNGEPIAPGQPRVLKSNDRIYIGDAVVTFVVDSR